MEILIQKINFNVASKKKFITLLFISLLPFSTLFAQVTVSADGPGDTYELFRNAWGGNVWEVPDCGHTNFGRHITEEYDDVLGKHVFAFHIHTDLDDDRCTNFDRQRNEVKTYGPSKPEVKAALGEIVVYRWKFKLDEGFQPSYSFTHIHQIKAGDGDAGAPVITITPRLASPERLEVLHNNGSGGTTTTLVQAPLADFKGTWVEAYEKIYFDEHGAYELIIKRISDGAILMSYSSNNIDMWRDQSTFSRPKWGIYRSLNNKHQLRDEQVRFNDFYIAEEIDTTTDPTDPDPTDITGNGGTVTAQFTTSKASENFPYAVDNNIHTKYYKSGEKALWIQYQSSTAETATKYAITSANDVPERDPKDWKLLGSNDGSTWTVLDSRSDQFFENHHLTKTYTVNNNSPYIFYRLDINANNGHSGTQLAEWRLYKKQSQTITFTDIPDKTYGDADFELSAEATSNLSVTYTIVSGPLTLNGNIAHITGAGTAVIRAMQEGDENFEAAPAVEQEIIIDKATQAISFSEVLPKNANESPLELMATGSSNLPVSFTVVSGSATLAGNLLTFTGTGEVLVSANQAGNENYLTAQNVSQTILVFENDEKKDGIKVKVYPNPTHGQLKVKLDNKEDKDYTFVIYNSQGKLIESTVLQRSNNKFEVDFDITSETNGFYYLSVSEGTLNIVKQIIKE